MPSFANLQYLKHPLTQRQAGDSNYQHKSVLR
jgi:hypothetical protein